MDYLYIRAWGKLLGSFDYYIENEVCKARKDNAPQTAIYRNDDKTWQTVENVCEETKRQVEAIVKEMVKGSGNRTASTS